MLLSFGFQIYDWLNMDPFSMGLGTRILPAERWIVLPLNHLFTILTGLLIFRSVNICFIERLVFIDDYFLSERFRVEPSDHGFKSSNGDVLFGSGYSINYNWG